MTHIKDSANVPGWYLLWVLGEKKEKTDVCVRALHPPARLQATHGKKNNSVQTISTFISHTHTQPSVTGFTSFLRTRGKVKLHTLKCI